MPGAGATSAGVQLVAGARPADPARGRIRRRLRPAATPIAALATLALATLGVANVAVARAYHGVHENLTRAQAAAARIPVDLGAGDTAALSGDLHLLQVAAGRSRSGSSGLDWRLVGRAGHRAGQVRSTRREAAALDGLGPPAERLRAALAELGGPTRPAGGPALLDDLDDLARTLNGYATAAELAGDPSAPALVRAATAAGLLTDLAGGEVPRTWTVCHAPAACNSWTVTSGTAAPARPVPIAAGSALRSRGGDLVVIGTPAQPIFVPAGGAQSVTRWNPWGAFALLYGLSSGAPATVRSPVMTEQHAIEELSRPTR